MSEHFDFLLKCNEDAEYGFVKWNKWRKNNNITMPELQNSNLSNISLPSVDSLAPTIGTSFNDGFGAGGFGTGIGGGCNGGRSWRQ